MNLVNDLPYIFALYMFFDSILVKLINRDIEELKNKIEEIEKEIKQIKERRDRR